MAMPRAADLLSAEDARFLERDFPNLDGWCGVPAATVTLALLNFQVRQGWREPLLEIGVYRGKYFSVLHRNARGSGSVSVGVDNFRWSTVDEFRDQLRQVFGGSEDVRLLECSSEDLSPADLLRHCDDTRPRFISVDGDHNPGPVKADLELADKILHQHGVIAADDFLNARAIGVSEGVYRFFIECEPNLVPFTFIDNKLLICRPESYELYKGVVRQLIEQHPELPFVQQFLELEKNGRHWVEPSLLGAEPFVF